MKKVGFFRGLRSFNSRSWRLLGRKLEFLFWVWRKVDVKLVTNGVGELVLFRGSRESKKNLGQNSRVLDPIVDNMVGLLMNPPAKY
jgi:hypothetical protein